MEASATNPFWYGPSGGTLVDRDTEIAAVVHALTNASKLFLLGDRRFGKTSLLQVAANEVAERGVAVLQFDAEAYETVELLAQAMAAGAAQLFAPSVEQAGEFARRVFGTLNPSAAYHLDDKRLTIEFDLTLEQRQRPVLALAAVLDGIEQLADTHGRPTAIVLDEFQEVILEGGDRAAHVLRATVEPHRYVGYVFAGSRVRLLTELSNDPSRPFWKFGTLRSVGPIPRADFEPYVRRGLESAGSALDDVAVERVFDVADDVPFNVQWLSSTCWNVVRIEQPPLVSAATVDSALDRILDEAHATYMLTWVNLTSAQRRTLKAIASAFREDFRLTEVAGAHGLPPSTMQRTLAALEDRSLIRHVASPTGVRWSLGDPFFARWLARLQVQEQ